MRSVPTGFAAGMIRVDVRQPIGRRQRRQSSCRSGIGYNLRTRGELRIGSYTAVDVQRHPTARRTAITFLAVYVAIIGGCAALGFWAQNTGHPLVSRIMGIVFMALIVGGIISCFTVARRCTCPTCGRGLRWQGRLSDRHTFVFECHTCNTAWDVGYSASGGFG